MDITVKIGNNMMVFVADCTRRADKAAAEAGYTVLKYGDLSLLRLFIKGETICGADIKTESAASAGLILYGHLKHLISSSVCGQFLRRV